MRRSEEGVAPPHLTPTFLQGGRLSLLCIWTHFVGPCTDLFGLVQIHLDVHIYLDVPIYLDVQIYLDFVQIYLDVQIHLDFDFVQPRFTSPEGRNALAVLFRISKGLTAPLGQSSYSLKGPSAQIIWTCR